MTRHAAAIATPLTVQLYALAWRLGLITVTYGSDDRCRQCGAHVAEPHAPHCRLADD